MTVSPSPSIILALCSFCNVWRVEDSSSNAHVSQARLDGSKPRSRHHTSDIAATRRWLLEHAIIRSIHAIISFATRGIMVILELSIHAMLCSSVVGGLEIAACARRSQFPPHSVPACSRQRRRAGNYFFHSHHNTAQRSG